MATTTTNNGWTIPQSTDLVSQGATAIATLGNGIDTSINKGLLAWVAFTPTWTNVTKGTSPTEAYHYVQMGKIVIARYKLQLGTSGTLTGAPTVTLPVTSNANAVAQMWPAYLYDNGNANYMGQAITQSTTVVGIAANYAAGTYLSGTNITATVPFTWGATDLISFTIVYDAA